MKGFVIALMMPALLQAQAQPTRELRPGTQVEVLGTRGDVVSSSASMLVVRTDRGIDSLPLASIGNWRWQSAKVATGAKAGAITGAIALSLLGLGFSGLCESDCGNAATNGLLIGAGIGTVLGAGVGAVVGSLFHNWNEEHGATPVVAPSLLGTFPVTAHVTIGTIATEAGVQFARDDTRLGVEFARVDLGQGSAPTFRGDPSDPRTLNTTDVSRDGRHVGVVVERKLVGDLWAIGSVMRRWSTESTTTRDWSNVTGPDFSHPLVTTTTRKNVGLGGSYGVVVRHRVIDDIYFRVDARQYHRPNSMRILTVGVEL